MAKTTKKSTKVAMDRQGSEDRRQNSDRRQKNEEVAVERRKVTRRRQIDPTTCERDYDAAEVEFMRALDDYKRSSGRMFPTCSEILEVVRDLGYVKTATSSGVAEENDPLVAAEDTADAALATDVDMTIDSEAVERH